MINVKYSELINFATTKGLKIQEVSRGSGYTLYVADGSFVVFCYVDSVNKADYEANYQANKNQKIDPLDKDTGGYAYSPKFAVDGWAEQMFELEMETSKLNSIHEKDIDDADIGWASLKFYEAGDVEITGGNLNQTYIDANCVRTDLAWMPDVDYMIKGGWVSQKVIPTNDIYVWAVGADLDAVYGGPQSVFLEGGLNLSFAASHTLMGLNGVAATRLNYNHPVLGDGKGTNRMRFIFRHPAGEKHRVQVVFDIFRG